MYIHCAYYIALWCSKLHARQQHSTLGIQSCESGWGFAKHWARAGIHMPEPISAFEAEAIALSEVVCALARLAAKCAERI